MNQFNYQNGRLFAENVDVVEIASALRTPFYCYSKASLREDYLAFEKALDKLNSRICYAVKANFNKEIIKMFNELEVEDLNEINKLKYE